MRKKIAAALAVLCLLCAVSLTGTAHAAGSAAIVGLKASGEELLAFVRSAGEAGEVSALLGRQESGGVEARRLEESGMELRTVILVDNSLSIPEAGRGEIQKQLLEIIAARRSGERFAVGTVGEQVTVLLDFTDDYTALKEAIEGMEYQNQDTYLTDALYDYLAEGPFRESWETFERILLISDGVDNKSIGYTKEELTGLLRESPAPIYAVGVGNGGVGNNEELENMFALARASGGAGFLLDEAAEKLPDALAADWGLLAVRVQIPEAAQDGSLQTLTLRLAEGETASLDGVRMPLKAAEEPSTEKEPVQVEPVPVLPEPEPVPLPPEEEGFPIWPVTVLIVGCAALLAAVLAWRSRKKKSAGEEESPVDERRREEPERRGEPEKKDAEEKQDPEERVTQLLGRGGSGTQRLWGQDGVFRVTLTDVHDSERFYQQVLEESLIVGSSRQSDICVSYDRTVSRKHCEIVREGGEVFLINHSQSNGTLLNGKRVTVKTPLTSGSVITMGRVEMRVEFEE